MFQSKTAGLPISCAARVHLSLYHTDFRKGGGGGGGVRRVEIGTLQAPCNVDIMPKLNSLHHCKRPYNLSAMSNAGAADDDFIMALSTPNKCSNVLQGTPGVLRPMHKCTGIPAVTVCAGVGWLAVDCICFSYSGVAMRPCNSDLSGRSLQTKTHSSVCYIRFTCPQKQ